MNVNQKLYFAFFTIITNIGPEKKLKELNKVRKNFKGKF